MSQQELLKLAIEALDRLQIPYMVTGSIASGIQGRPRATHDIDVVVEVSYRHATELCNEFPPPRFYVDDKTAREAVAQGSMFNLIDTDSGDKVDFWVLPDDPFYRSCFSRRQLESVSGQRMYVPRPEDTILLKLRWAKISGGSEKQFGDALGIFEVQGGALDLDYCRGWADQLQVRDLWDRLLREARLP